MNSVRIDYKKLRKSSPETARLAVLEYLSSNGGNVSDCAKVFGINRTVVYDIIRKSQEGDLKDRSRAPRNVARKTPQKVENQVVEAARITGLPPKRLSFYIFKYYGLDIAYGTLRHILRRNGF
ncbi:helix-turn-helix domain-containing protein [Candidatus Microgenomates bacterium]|nr:helix-turn-helix domain-containing protein [Candidatus Microgenomates bacterium]